MGLLEALRSLLEALARIINAVFKRKTFTVTVTDPEGQGTTVPGVGVYTVNVGDEFSVMATPAEGWEFDHWNLEDGTKPTANPLKLTS